MLELGYRVFFFKYSDPQTLRRPGAATQLNESGVPVQIGGRGITIAKDSAFLFHRWFPNNDEDDDEGHKDDVGDGVGTASFLVTLDRPIRTRRGEGL